MKPEVFGMQQLAEMTVSLPQVAFAVLTVLSAVGVVFAKKVLHSALWLILTFFLIGVHYALLGAHFLATLQILVYAGAIMVLIVFVIMLLGVDRDIDPDPAPRSLLFLLISSATILSLAGTMFFVFYNLGGDIAARRSLLSGSQSVAQINRDNFEGVGSIDLGSIDFGSAKTLGQKLFTEYLIPFEVISLLLLAAVIVAVVLAYEPKRPLPLGRGLKAKQTRVSDN